MVAIPSREPVIQVDFKTYVIKFGKYKGSSLKEIWKNDPSYVRWMAGENVGKINLPVKLSRSGIKIISNKGRYILDDLAFSNMMQEISPPPTKPVSIHSHTKVPFIESIADFSWIVFP